VVNFAFVGPDFFTNWTSWSYTRVEPSWSTNRYSYDAEFRDDVAVFLNDVTALQNYLLNGQYLEPSKFENLTNDECKSRYNSQFITSGSGFGVPVPEEREKLGISASNSFHEYWAKSGEFGLDVEFSCASSEFYGYCPSP
jgi:hypothetical protein